MTQNDGVHQSGISEWHARPEKQMPTLAARAANAVWWSTLELAARFGVQFVVLVFLARLLVPSDFGLVAMVLAFTSIGALLVDSGFSTALIQRQRTTDDDESTVFVFALSSGFLLVALFWLTAPFVADFYSQPELVELTRALALVLPLGALASVPDALLTMHLQFKVRARAEMLSSLCSGAMALWLAFNGFGAWSLVWQAIIAAALRALLLWIYTGWRPGGRFSTASFRSLFGFGGYMLMSNLLDTVSVRLQSLLIGKLFDSRALGFYTIAQNTQQAPTSFFAAILNRVGLPLFASVADQPARLRGVLRMFLQVSMFLFLPGMVGIGVLAEPLVTFLYGQRWQPAAPILIILALSAAFWPMHVLNLAAINALGRSDLSLRLTVVKKTVLVALVILLSPGGPIGVAGAVLISSLIALVVNSYYSKRLLDYGFMAQLRDQRGTLALSLLAAWAGWLTLKAVPDGAIAETVAVTVAASIYLVGALISGHPALRRLRWLFGATQSISGAH